MVQADKIAISFDLGTNFDENSMKSNEMEQILLPDAVTADLMNIIGEK